ncbi:hypothetical protein NUW54_g12038 [Trametes sanguinea]|uniref:Uncharacterized protein n=1 Tax=Trametes sanguinea TaxID=158606 RepID=A0ACC1N2U1_9APHY|nr:hypothetical protein NUW54_g12038 [Trametes sanguinea]
MRFQLLSLLLLPLLAAASTEEQMVLPSESFQDSHGEPFVPVTHSGKPSLADLLTIESSASIFYSYARETELSKIFSDPNAKNTLLVPTNKAVIALPRKPHEGPAPIREGVILSEAEFDDLSKKNVERWVSAHIIPFSVSLSSPGEYRTLLEGKNVSFTPLDGDENAPEWARVVLNGDVRLTGIREVSMKCLGVTATTAKEPSLTKAIRVGIERSHVHPRRHCHSRLGLITSLLLSHCTNMYYYLSPLANCLRRSSLSDALETFPTLAIIAGKVPIYRFVDVDEQRPVTSSERS